MGFFKKDESQEKQIQAPNEIKIEIEEAEKKGLKKKNLLLFDVDTIQYVIENFPSMSIQIQNGLNNLADILENAIDYIEDKSSDIIKKNRDFKLSKDHRGTSIAIYEVVENLGEYVNWMQDEYEKNIKNEETKLVGINEKPKDEIQEKYIEEKKEDSNNKITDEEEIEIYKDFSLKEPKAFRLEDNVVIVEDWDDLLVKTAEVLTKQYRKSKNSNKVIKEIKPIERKSVQNSFRDTVIEMLTEYKIDFENFKITIK